MTTKINKRDLIALGLAGAAAAAFPASALAQAAKAGAKPQEDIVFGASVPLSGVFAFAGIGIDAASRTT